MQTAFDRQHRGLDQRTPASAYGLEALPQQENSRIALPPAGGIIETGGGRSAAAGAAVAPVALPAPAATAAATSPWRAVPPYSGPETAQHMGTSQEQKGCKAMVVACGLDLAMREHRVVEIDYTFGGRLDASSKTTNAST